jgi:hypothetical protein
MTDVNTIALGYIDLWNERSPARRREMLAANWASDARYIDPLMSGDGHDGVDSPIKGTDFAVVSDGRIKSVTGFLDQLPQGACGTTPEHGDAAAR